MGAYSDDANEPNVLSFPDDFQDRDKHELRFNTSPDGGWAELFDRAYAECRLCISASLDLETDRRVQQAIRKLYGITILTVAHRLKTIMDYDKIIVLGEGQVLEYDSPKALLSNPKGFLRSLVDASTEKQELEDLAGYHA